MLYLVDRLTRDVGCYFSVLGIYFAHTTERKILRMKFNEKLIEIRKKQGLSQEELGMELQVSRQTISKWETGICLMDMSLLKPLSEILQVSVIDILSGEKVDENKIKEKAEENLISLSEFNHYESVTKGTIFLLIVAIILIIYSLIKNIECFGYSTLLFGFSAVVYYNKYKQNKDRKLLFYFGCMAAAFAFNFIAFIVSAM